jgi:hypothetical protein
MSKRHNTQNIINNSDGSRSTIGIANDPKCPVVKEDSYGYVSVEFEGQTYDLDFPSEWMHNGWTFIHNESGMTLYAPNGSVAVIASMFTKVTA